MENKIEANAQAIIACEGFCLGVFCDESHLTQIRFLASCAEIAPQNALAEKVCAQLCAYLKNPKAKFDLPLLMKGSDFYRAVWRAIAHIPYGQTQSYGQIAQAIKNAPRAVGQACGANPFPVIVPCHRVITSDGKLGGFARNTGGFLLETKRWLLAHEGHLF